LLASKAVWVICIAHKFVFFPTYFADRKEYRLGQKNFSIKHNQQKDVINQPAG